MSLGGCDTRLHQSPMVFANRSNRDGFYDVKIRHIYLRDGMGGPLVNSVDPAARVVISPRSPTDNMVATFKCCGLELLSFRYGHQPIDNLVATLKCRETEMLSFR